MNKKQQLNLVYLFVALWGVVLFQTFWGHTASQAQLSYSEFERYLQQGWLKDLVVDQQTIRGSFKEPIEGKDHFVTPRVDIDLKNLPPITWTIKALSPVARSPP